MCIFLYCTIVLGYSVLQRAADGGRRRLGRGVWDGMPAAAVAGADYLRTKIGLFESYASRFCCAGAMRIARERPQRRRR